MKHIPFDLGHRWYKGYTYALFLVDAGLFTGEILDVNYSIFTHVLRRSLYDTLSDRLSLGARIKHTRSARIEKKRRQLD
jgi:hypothetical protein